MAVVQETSVLDQVTGRILDTDSHEWIPTMYWEEAFGAATAPFAAMMDMMPATGIYMNYALKVRDEAEIDPATIWTVKGSPAPAAIDMSRRPAVMDAMGVARQLVFPSGPGIFGLFLATCPAKRVIGKLLNRDLQHLAEQAGLTDADAVELGRQFLTGYHEWCLRVAAMDHRLRPVAPLDTSNMASAIAVAERLIEGGVRAVMIPADTPPDGKSPANADLDPLWRLFAEAQVPVLIHAGGELNFMTSTAWGEGVPAFESNPGDMSEVATDPYNLSTFHLGAQNFLTAMVLGGVFERHPELRVGVVELTSHWVGPMAENLTMWGDQFAKRLSATLSLSPSEYLNRNVRVTSFWWEPVDKYIERFGLEDVYTFSSDYPHYEGGVDTARLFADRLSRLGPDIVEKFFVTNGELLLPE